MAYWSRVWADRLMESSFGGSQTTNQNTLYAALFTTVPDAVASGTELSYVSGYDRPFIPQSMWVVSSGGVRNATSIIFGPATAAWATVFGWGFFTAGSAGIRIAQGSLQVSRTINSGDTAQFGVGDVRLTMITSFGLPV